MTNPITFAPDARSYFNSDTSFCQSCRQSFQKICQLTQRIGKWLWEHRALIIAALLITAGLLFLPHVGIPVLLAAGGKFALAALAVPPTVATATIASGTTIVGFKLWSLFSKNGTVRAEEDACEIEEAEPYPDRRNTYNDTVRAEEDAGETEETEPYSDSRNLHDDTVQAEEDTNETEDNESYLDGSFLRRGGSIISFYSNDYDPPVASDNYGTPED